MDPSNKEHPGNRRKKKPKAAVAPTPPETSADAGGQKVIDEERLKKIARLKKAVEDGTYRISNEEVARKLIEHMLEPKE
jgi:anti-sigma28 factor (negative regulator of flagellin synthesis)